jgi:hypothetical protein
MEMQMEMTAKESSEHFVDLLEAKLNRFIKSKRDVKVDSRVAPMLTGNILMSAPIQYQVLVAELTALDIKQHYAPLDRMIVSDFPCVIDYKTVLFTIGKVDVNLNSKEGKVCRYDGN